MTLREKIKRLNEIGLSMLDNNSELSGVQFEIKDWPLSEMMEWAAKIEDRIDLVMVAGQRVMRLLAQSSADTLNNITIFVYSRPVKVINPQVIEEI